MSAPTQTSVLTGEQLARMSGYESCELVEGQIKKMSPTSRKHARIEVKIARYLDEFVSGHDLGEVLGGEVGIYTRRNPDTVRGADVLFISHERLAETSPEGFLDVAPELVVEVLSPSNTWQEIRQKIEEYFGIGVERVWIVEPENRAVLVYRSPEAVRTLSEKDRLEGEGLLEGFALEVAELFG